MHTVISRTSAVSLCFAVYPPRTFQNPPHPSLAPCSSQFFTTLSSLTVLLAPFSFFYAPCLFLIILLAHDFFFQLHAHFKMFLYSMFLFKIVCAPCSKIIIWLLPTPSSILGLAPFCQIRHTSRSAPGLPLTGVHLSGIYVKLDIMSRNQINQIYLPRTKKKERLTIHFLSNKFEAAEIQTALHSAL